MSQAVRMLLGEGRITREQYERAVTLEARHGETLTYHLVAGGAIGADELAKFMVNHFPCAYWPRSRLASLPRDVVELLSPELAGELRVIPLALAGKTLTLGITDPSRSHALDEAAYYSGCTIVAAVVSETDMTFALEKHYGIRPPGPFEKRSSRPPSSPPPAKHPSLAPLPLMRGRELAGPGYRPPAPAPTDAPALGRRSRSTRPLEAIREEAIPLVTRAAPKSHREDIPEAVAGARGRVDVRPPVLVDGRRGGRRRVGDVSPPAEPVRRPVSDSWESPPPPEESWASLNDEPAGPRAKAPRSEPPPRAERASGKIGKSEGEIIASIDMAKSRGDVVGLALGYMLRFARRAIFLAVKKTEIRGFDVAGSMTSREAIKSFWVPISSPCTLQEVVRSRQIRLGPLAQTPADGVFAAALGGRPARALVVPVIIRDRVAGLLYADGLDDDLPPWNRLTHLADSVGSAFARLLTAGGAP
ncbi:MAG: hypothetical protein PHU25_07355 [Deltaproteobacteria bacterium]|nr:hypothetical protein [Deltaproteobacteria bacterium]